MHESNFFLILISEFLYLQRKHPLRMISIVTSLDFNLPPVWIVWKVHHWHIKIHSLEGIIHLQDPLWQDPPQKMIRIWPIENYFCQQKVTIHWHQVTYQGVLCWDKMWIYLEDQAIAAAKKLILFKETVEFQLYPHPLHGWSL